MKSDVLKACILAQILQMDNPAPEELICSAMELPREQVVPLLRELIREDCLEMFYWNWEGTMHPHYRATEYAKSVQQLNWTQWMREREKVEAFLQAESLSSF